MAPHTDAEANVQLPNPGNQRTVMKSLLENAPELELGQTWYLVSKKWYVAWQQYAEGTAKHPPGPIDNSSLFDQHGVKPFAVEGVHFSVLDEPSWNKLVEWYGLVDPSHVIKRKTVEKQGRVVVDTAYLRLKAVKNGGETGPIVDVSRNATVDDLHTLAKAKLDIPEEEETRLWDFHLTDWRKELSGTLTIEDAMLFQSQLVCVETKNEDGSWPSDERQSGSESDLETEADSAGAGSGLQPLGADISPPSSPTGPQSLMRAATGMGSSAAGTSPLARGAREGRTGLTNLGNTCFMSSALQCLSHTRALTEYFLDGRYRDDLNPDNPIGCGGRLAQAYSELVEKLWRGTSRVVTPREFKYAIGRFAPQFVGYQQHDSQELTSFLLDGLHEDLNRIRNKPYVEMKEAEEEDEEAARLAWERHKLRNDSIIVDLFHGQLKSTLVCPDCNKVSITFDPFMYLQVPLPENESKVFPVVVAYRDAQKAPCKFGVKLPKTTGTIAMMCTELEKLTGIPANRLVVTDVYNGKVWKVLDPHEKTSSIRVTDHLIAHELENPLSEDVVALPVYFFRENMYRHKDKLRAPAVVTVPGTVKGADLRALAHKLLRPFVKDEEQQGEKAAPSAMQEDDDWSGGDDDDEDDGFTQELESTFQKNQTRKLGGKSTAEDNGHVEENGAAEGNAESAAEVDLDLRLYVGDKYASRLREVDADTEFELDPDMGDAFVIIVEDFERVDFDIVDSVEEDSTLQQSGEVSKGSVPLSTCLDFFTSKERLSHDNMWRCPACKEPKEAQKQMEVWTLPEVLVIHLKRFSYNSFWRDKLDTLVDFPLEGLHLGPYVLNPKQRETAVYDLYGVDNHMGGLGGGHYTAYCLNQNGRWYEFDDSYVGEIAAENIASTSSYLLFYQRRRDLSKHALTGAPVPVPELMDTTHGSDDDDDADDEGDNGDGNASHHHASQSQQATNMVQDPEPY